MLREVPVIVNSKTPVIDVRDVALAHYRALCVPEAAGKRFILANESIWFPDIAKLLHKDFGKYYDIPMYVVPKFLISLVGNFVPEMKMFAKSIDKDTSYDDYDTSAILGVKKNIPTQKSLKEMVETMIATGYIPDLRKEEESHS